MKPVLAWMKTNLVSVILLTVSVIALPVGVIVGQSIKAKTLKTVESDVARQMSDLSSVRVSYAVEPLLPHGRSFSVSAPPNEATNEAIRGLLAKQSEQAAVIRAGVQAFNRAHHAPLVDGLLPAPASQFDEQPLADQFVRRWVGAHESLLDGIGAGMPPSPEEVKKRLEDVRFAEEQRILSGRAAAELTEEDKQAITQRLTSERLQLYASRGLQARVYADVSAFADAVEWKESKPPTLADVWDMQWSYWVAADIVRAIGAANHEDRSVMRGPVKRIERIAVEPLASTSATQGPFEDETAAVTADASKSLTGRVAWPESPNAVYDLRVAEVTLLVDAARIPAVLNAFGSANLMSVLSVQIDGDVDVHSDLRSGFVYSREVERVVRLRMKVESLWLRAWLREWMPAEVKTVMGYPDAPPPEASPEAMPSEDGAMSEPPPPPPAGGHRAGQAESGGAMGDIGKDQGGPRGGRRGGPNQ